MKKRIVTPFSLAFLDIMFCGFGAVVLLVMILNGEVLKKREAQSEDLRGELSRATVLEQLARENLTMVREKVEAATLEQGGLRAAIGDREAERLNAERSRAETLRKLRETEREQARLEAERDALRKSAELIRAKPPEDPKTGTRKIGFSGDGERQYLTGLKLGGKRTLVLLDASSSMLDETIVNIVRRKLMPPDRRAEAPKWQRAVRAAHWLVANFQPGSRYQVYAFNTTAEPVVGDSGGRWLSADDASDLRATIDGLRTIVPEGGTSLHRAFRVANLMSPPPDSIILLTDGLPTQDLLAKKTGPVSSDERVALFRSAAGSLPGSIPVNTMLFPIEGDPLAAALFWELAITSKGSFMTPTRDWP